MIIVSGHAFHSAREPEFRLFAGQQLHERLVTIRQYPNIQFRTVSYHFLTANGHTIIPLRVSSGSYSALGIGRSGFAIAVFRIGKDDTAYGIVYEKSPSCLTVNIDELINEIERLRELSDAEAAMQHIIECLDDITTSTTNSKVFGRPTLTYQVGRLLIFIAINTSKILALLLNLCYSIYHELR